MDSPQPPPLTRTNDEEHLKLLAIFHYVVAGIGALFACFPLIHVALGLMMVLNPEALAGGGPRSTPPPAAIGYLFVVVGTLFVLTGWTAAIFTLISGRMLAQRRRRMFSLVMAAILCVFVPFGTVLGIFTILVLNRDSVQRLYEQKA